MQNNEVKNSHCPIIHGGLSIDIQDKQKVFAHHCCLRTDSFEVDINSDIWTNKKFIPLRNTNLNNKWDVGCWTCQGNELSGLSSFRSGQLSRFGVKTNLSGPQFLTLKFDNSCNLACRTCGPNYSTFWQKHIKEHKISIDGSIPYQLSPSGSEDMIKILKKIDLSNLEVVIFVGGETLMGDAYWKVADAIAKLVPNAKEKVILSFQTNGTHPIKEKYFKIIEKFQTIKLSISLDGIGDRFNYLRWPADWHQVVENMNVLKTTLPANAWFYIEETISIFNLYYQSELADWAKNNFAANKLGYSIDHNRHVAHGIFGLQNLTQEYIDAISNTDSINLINADWQENPTNIRKMINEITKFDNVRRQEWRKIFPEVAEFYSRYLR